MAETSRSRSFLASVVGWVVVIVIAWFVLRGIVGTVLWILRTLLVIALILGLITLYVKLKRPSRD